MSKYFAAFVIVLLFHSTAFSQTTNGSINSVGISALLSSSQIDIVVPVRLSSHSVIGPSVGYVFVADGGADYRLGVMTRIFFSEKQVKPFIGCRAGIIFGSRKHSDAMTDGLGGIMGGAEYFINEFISTGIEAQLNATFSGKNSSRFGNPGRTNINTATALYVTLYF